MDIKVAFGMALKKARNAKNLTQEDFGIVSSRTYVSTIERGLKSVTLEKTVEFANLMGIHPITLITLAYKQFATDSNFDELIQRIINEIVEIENN